MSEALIPVTEVYHTLKFGPQEDARRDAHNVVCMTGSLCAQDSNEPLCFLTELDQCLAVLRMKSRLMIITMPKTVQPNSVPKFVVTGNVLHHNRVKCVFWFLPEREVDAFERSSGLGACQVCVVSAFLYMCAWCWYTQGRFERAHGDVLSGHTGLFSVSHTTHHNTAHTTTNRNNNHHHNNTQRQRQRRHRKTRRERREDKTRETRRRKTRQEKMKAKMKDNDNSTCGAELSSCSRRGINLTIQRLNCRFQKIID